MTTLTFKMAANDAILILICMYIGAIYGGSRSAILLNIPGTPANAATTLDGFPARPPGRGGPGHGHRDHRIVPGQHDRHPVPGHDRPGARRVRARFRRLRVLLAGRLRDRDLRPPDRARRSDQGLDLGLSRPARGDGRPGGRARLPALCLWQHRSCRRHRPAAGAGRRVRLLRGPDRDEGAGGGDRAGRRPTGCCRSSRT